MEALTFSELRKIQKEESRQDELSDLNDKFLLRVADYLESKREISEDREARNAKRILNKIISLREDKIVKNAKLSVKSDVDASGLNLLPREKELYRKLKELFADHRESIEKEVEKEDIKINEREKEETQKDREKKKQHSEKSKEENYQKLEITAHVPEFMGTDLETYGPFEEGQEVRIPEENAEILVNRGNAEIKENG